MKTEADYLVETYTSLATIAQSISDRLKTLALPASVAQATPEPAENTMSVVAAPVETPTNRLTALPFSAKLPDDFLNSVLWIEDTLGLSAHNLICCMGFETGRTFSPSIQSPVSTATGLIQFMKATAQRLGTSTSELAQMSAVQQLSYVYKYFKDYANRDMDLSKWNLGDTYMAILWPAGIGKPDDHVIFAGGPTYAANKGLDKDHNGNVTRGECLMKIREVEAEGMAQRRPQ